MPACRSESADESHDGVVELIDRAADTGQLPAAILRRWEQATDDDALWRFRPTVVNGALAADSILVEGDAVSAIVGWSALAVGDPARDLHWLLTSRGAAAEPALDAYSPVAAAAPTPTCRSAPCSTASSSSPDGCCTASTARRLDRRRRRRAARRTRRQRARPVERAALARHRTDPHRRRRRAPARRHPARPRTARGRRHPAHRQLRLLGARAPRGRRARTAADGRHRPDPARPQRLGRRGAR